MFTISSVYFPLRWHSKTFFDQDKVEVDETNGENNVCEYINLTGVVHCPPKSKSKKKAKEGKEVNMKQVKSCILQTKRS